MKIRIKVKRFNPENGEGERGHYFQLYNVETAPGMTVLDALLKIADEDDTSLSFRRSCRSAICGSCAMVINGHAKLACKTQVLPEHEKFGEVVVEPLANHNVIKDLIVDFTPFWNKISKFTPFLTPLEGREEVNISAADEAAIDQAQSCIMCGSCNSECNALEIDPEYAGPAALAKAWRFVGDVRESEGQKRLERLSMEHNMWDCVRCVHCTEYCPKGVRPLRQIERLRASAIERGITDNHGAKHTLSMANSVKRVGRLDEAAMTFKTLGFLRSLGMIPFGLKMELHGKMPKPLIFSQIEGMDEVKAIFNAIEERKKEKE